MKKIEQRHHHCPARPMTSNCALLLSVKGWKASGTCFRLSTKNTSQYSLHGLHSLEKSACVCFDIDRLSSDSVSK